MAEHRLETSCTFPQLLPCTVCTVLDEVTFFAPSPFSLPGSVPPSVSPLFFIAPTRHPSAHPVSFCPFFGFSPSSHSPDPCCCPDSGTKRGEGSQSQLTNSRLAKASIQPMKCLGDDIFTNQGRDSDKKGLD